MVVLLHGGYDHARSWDRVAAALSARYCVIVPDARGHGESAWSAEGRYALLDHVADVASLFDHLYLRAAVVIGHSYGGRVALRHAGIYPDKIEKLVAIEALGPRPEERAQWHATSVGRRVREHVVREKLVLAKARRRFESLAECGDQILARNPGLERGFAMHLAEHGSQREPDGRYVWRFDPRVGLTHPVDVSPDEELRLFSAIVAPTLLIHGTASSSAPPEGDERVEALSDCRVSWVPGAGHWIHQDSLGAFLAVVEEFVGG